MDRYDAEPEKLDEEWVQLIKAAKEIGLSVEQVRRFFETFLLPRDRDNYLDMQA